MIDQDTGHDTSRSALRTLAGHFKGVLVTGARQVGKSTLLAHAFPDSKCVTFDPIQDLYGARRDPDLFLDNFPAPLVLDEIQFAPELLPALDVAPGEILLNDWAVADLDAHPGDLHHAPLIPYKQTGCRVAGREVPVRAAQEAILPPLRSHPH